MNRTTKPALLICYDYFYPAYKAGGPIQSLINLVLLLQDEFDVSVITSSYDLNTKAPLEKIKTGVWSTVILPGSANPVNVLYNHKSRPGKAVFRSCIEKIKPEVIYLNGMFSYRFVILPLITAKKIRIVICPRGMLQLGALAGKSFKKKLYLGALKILGVVKHVYWHATNAGERDDIKRIFGNGSKIIIAGNIPKKPIPAICYPGKKKGQLRLIYLSLISTKKNLLQLLENISRINAAITLDIYGPVKDANYWEKCEMIIKRNPGKIMYKGDVLPEFVQATFDQYDASVLLTRGENFGHALYESMSAGRPIITSYFTPWTDLEQKKAGWNIDISNEKKLINTIENIADMDADMFNEYCTGAYSLANKYYKSGIDISAYKQLFIL